ncbi:MAG: type II toxin-antitoxin system antitoxin SocA domain-containing protein [Burkholderia cenocepacia]
MATVLDVASYILAKTGEMSAMKLQKLAYYSQAWSLVWDEEPLFNNRFEAWANGPVSPMLYEAHRGNFLVDAEMVKGNPEALTESQRDTIDGVLAFYGDKSAQWLSDLTHEEDPWKDARGDLPPMARSNEVITTAAMHEYYSAL